MIPTFFQLKNGGNGNGSNRFSSSLSYDVTSDPSASMRMSSSSLVMPGVPDYSSSGIGGLERSTGVYGSRSSLMTGGEI